MRHDQLPDPWTTPFVSITIAGELLHMSRRTAYRAAAAGELPTVKLGGVRRVAVTDLYRLQRLPVPARQSARRPVIAY